MKLSHDAWKIALCTPASHMHEQACLPTPALRLQVQASLQHHLSFRNEAYILTLHADTAGMQPANVSLITKVSLCTLLSHFSLTLTP